MKDESLKAETIERLSDEYDRSDSGTAWSECLEGCYDAGFDAGSALSAMLEQLTVERERREELEVVAAALYLGHDDAKEQFDMYRDVYLTAPADSTAPEGKDA